MFRVPGLPSGPLASPQVRELLEECKDGGGCLPVNVVFLLEGEEENGSVGFRETVQQNMR